MRDAVETTSATVHALAFAIGSIDETTLVSLLDVDVRWLQVGRQPVVGRDAVIKVLERYGAASSLVVHHVVADARRGVVDGVAVLGGKARGFCHVAELNDDGTQVCALTTYLVNAA
jgi:hypothetical protein